MLGSAESEKVRVISRQIIFGRILTYIIMIPQRYRRTGGQTDRRTTCLGNTALRYASRGNKSNILRLVSKYIAVLQCIW